MIDIILKKKESNIQFLGRSYSTYSMKRFQISEKNKYIKNNLSRKTNYGNRNPEFVNLFFALKLQWCPRLFLRTISHRFCLHHFKLPCRVFSINPFLSFFLSFFFFFFFDEIIAQNVETQKSKILSQVE